MVASGVAQRFDLFILACLRTVFFGAPQSAESLWASDQPVAETSAWRHITLTADKQTNIHVPGGIRTHNLNRRAAEDLRLRPRGHWDNNQLDVLPLMYLFYLSTCFEQHSVHLQEIDCINTPSGMFQSV